MKATFRFITIGVLLSFLLMFGCASSTKEVMATKESQLKLRSIQARAFETTDKTKMLRTVISTLQDLGFVVDKADDKIGLVSGTKLSGYSLRMTVTVNQRGSSQLLVRANAQYNVQAVEDPEPYQQFFDALSKSIFLAAQQVD
jgi:hypothetical protein